MDKNISIERVRELKDAMRAEADAKQDMIDDGFMDDEYGWTGSFLVRNRITSEVDHGPLKSIAGSVGKAIGNHYLELLDEYPPVDGWEPPSIIMDTEPLVVFRQDILGMPLA